MKEDSDILIMGGGAAGIAAAVAAARSGNRVILLEKNGYAGGNATAAYVGTICGLYYRNPKREARFAMEGFPKEFALRVQRESNSQPIQFGHGLHFLPYKRAAFMRVADAILEESNVKVLYHATITNLVKEGNHVTGVKALIGNQPVNIGARAIIDTTGNALSAQLGITELVEEENYQASAQVFGMGGVKIVDEKILSLSIIRTIQRGLADGSYPKSYVRLSIIPGTYHDDTLFFKLGIPLPVDNSPGGRSTLEMFAREAIVFIEKYLQSHCDLFDTAYVNMVAPEVGIRTGPRHKGKVLLTKKDVLSAGKNNNGIARGVWPIEFWAPGENPRMEYFEVDDYYDIPAGCLISNALENLFFAGRHIFAEDDAIASARVIGTCLATGYAAGKLAAGYLTGKAIENTIQEIRQELAIS